jgi:hypothetical protein
MTPESQRIAIAEVCGFSEIRMSKHWELWDEEPRSRLVGVTSYCSIVQVPNYLTDLNAMHEAEKQLIAKSQQDRFMYYLQQGYASDQFWCIAHATAAQRAEAFLRTLNLWKDDE